MLIKILRTLFVTTLVVITMVMFGCAAFMNAVTPCHIEEAAGEYTGQELTSIMPYTTLADAERIDAYLGYKHEINQLEGRRTLEDDDIEYSHLTETMRAHLANARELRTLVFDPGGPIGMLVPALCGLGLGGVLIKRPGDLRKDEVENV